METFLQSIIRQCSRLIVEEPEADISEGKFYLENDLGDAVGTIKLHFENRSFQRCLELLCEYEEDVELDEYLNSVRRECMIQCGKALRPLYCRFVVPSRNRCIKYYSNFAAMGDLSNIRWETFFKEHRSEPVTFTDSLILSGDLDGAVEVLRTIPLSLRSVIRLALISYLKGEGTGKQRDECSALMNCNTSTDDDKASFYLHYGLFAFLEGEIQTAALDFSNALDAVQLFPMAACMLAICNVKLGGPTDELKKLVQVRSSPILNIVGEALMETEEQDAIAIFEIAFELDRDDPDVLVNMGRVATIECIKLHFFELAVSSDPTSEFAWLHLALYHYRHSNWQTAISCYDRAVESTRCALARETYQGWKAFCMAKAKARSHS